MKDYKLKSRNIQEGCIEWKLDEKENINSLEELARHGARVMLRIALNDEIKEFMEKGETLRDEEGRRLVYRNGYHREREIQTGIGPIKVKQPRVDSRKAEVKFNSKILPKYMRRTESIDAFIPILYLNGVSTGDFSEVMEGLLGKGKGLSANTVVRLKAEWEKEYAEWRKRDLSAKRYCYIWADGIYLKHRDEEDEKSCILVVIGVNENGDKEFLAIDSGIRESALSWKEVLLGLRERGMEEPKLAIGDGGMGFWSALREVYPQTREQRCWVHKTANVLNQLPKKLHPMAKKMLQEIYLSPDKAQAERGIGRFGNVFEDKYPKAVKSLTKDAEELLTFYDFPAAHFQHIRTTNPIESSFSTIRLRTKKMRNCGNRKTTLAMLYKLSQQVEKGWRKLRGFKEIPYVLEGMPYLDGSRMENAVV